MAGRLMMVGVCFLLSVIRCKRCMGLIWHKTALSRRDAGSNPVALRALPILLFLEASGNNSSQESMAPESERWHEESCSRECHAGVGAKYFPSVCKVQADRNDVSLNAIRKIVLMFPWRHKISRTSLTGPANLF